MVFLFIFCYMDYISYVSFVFVFGWEVWEFRERLCRCFSWVCFGYGSTCFGFFGKMALILVLV